LTNQDFSGAFVFGNEKEDGTLTFVTNPFCCFPLGNTFFEFMLYHYLIVFL
jgi:hypothetical protein